MVGWGDGIVRFGGRYESICDDELVLKGKVYDFCSKKKVFLYSEKNARMRKAF